MYSLPLTFKDFDDVTLFEAYGQVGVYVLWNKRSRDRPLRIGQGLILQRFCAHVRNPQFAWPIFGIVSILGDETKENSIKARVAESILLHVADDINRFPATNSNLEGIGLLRAILRRENVIKVRIRGRDPFMLAAPMKNKPLYTPKIIKAWLDEEAELALNYPWHSR